MTARSRTVPLHHRAGELRAAVARLRRAYRDVRDRTARRNWRWRAVAVAGMATGGGTALLLIRHTGVDRAAVAEVLGKRWPSSVVGDVGAEPPSWTFAAEYATELARTCRRVEPLRIIVLAQRAANTGERRRTAVHEPAEPFAPMPIAL
jgi:dienelactone hydrolase